MILAQIWHFSDHLQHLTIYLPSALGKELVSEYFHTCRNNLFNYCLLKYQIRDVKAAASVLWIIDILTFGSTFSRHS